MRLWAVATVAGAFLLPLALLAQHAAAPAPAHIAQTVTHTSATPSVAARVSSIPSTRVSSGTSPTSSHGFHGTGRTNDPRGTIAKDDKQPKPVSNAKPEKRGFFSLLRKRQHSQTDLRNRRKRNPSSASNSLAQDQTVVPPKRLGCRVVPVPNPGVPCNMLSPCCP